MVTFRCQLGDISLTFRSLFRFGLKCARMFFGKRTASLASANAQTAALMNCPGWTAFGLAARWLCRPSGCQSDIGCDCIQVNTYWRRCELWLNGFSHRKVTEPSPNRPGEVTTELRKPFFTGAAA